MIYSTYFQSSHDIPLMEDKANQSWLFSRGARSCLLGLAILNLAVFCYEWGWFHADKVMQLAASRSLIDGTGLTYVTPAYDLARTSRQWIGFFPPGYTLIAAAILGPLTRAIDSLNAMWWAATLVDWFGIVLFYGCWFFLLEEAGDFLESRTRNLIWVYWALVWPALMATTSSGVLAVDFFSLGIWIGIKAIGKPRASNALWLISGILVGLASLMHQSYLPLIAVVPMATSWLYYRKNALWFLPSFLNFVGASLPPLGLYLYNDSHSTFFSSIGFYYQGKTLGIYWDQLRYFCPFPFTFLGEELAISRFFFHGNASAWMTPMAWFITLAMVYFAGWGVCSFWRRLRSASTDNTEKARVGNFFLLAFGLGSLITLAQVFFLTLHYPGYVLYGTLDYFWVHAREPRYFTLVYLFLFVFAVNGMVDPRAWAQPQWLRRAHGSIVVIGLVLSALTAGFQIQKYARFYTKEYLMTWQYYRHTDDAKNLEAVLRQKISEAQGAPVFFLDEPGKRQDQAIMAGASGITFSDTPNLSLKSSAPAYLLAVDDDSPSTEVARYIHSLALRYHARPLKRFSDFTLVEIYFPGQNDFSMTSPY